MLKQYSVDRIEGENAILIGNNSEKLTVPCHLLPPNCREGSVLCQTAEHVFVPDNAETEARRKRISALEDRLFHDENGGK